MTFLNASLIFGALAVAVPIVLHFIARREPKQVVFPSVRLLVRRVESNRSKLQIRRWWLLALRILALAVLALALARPAIHRALSLTWLTIGLLVVVGIALLAMASVAMAKKQNRSTTMGLAGAAGLALAFAALWGLYTAASGVRPSIDSSQPVALAIVVDNSPTSAWKTPDDERLARIREFADDLIATLPPTSPIAIIDRSSTPAAFSLDVASAVSKVAQLQALEVTQPLESRLDTAKRLLETSDLSMRHIVLITDLSTSTFNAPNETAASPAELPNEALVADALSTDALTVEGDTPDLLGRFSDDSGIGLSILDLGEFRGGNRSVSLPMLSDETPPAGAPIAVTTTISVTGTSENTDPEEASVGGDVNASLTIELQLFENDRSLPVLRDGKIVRPAAKSVDRRSVVVSPNQPVEVRMTLPPLPTGQHHGVVRLVGRDAMSLDDAAYFTVNVLPAVNLLMVGDNEIEANELARAITLPYEPDEPEAEYSIQRISYDDLPVVRLDEFPAIMLLDPPRDILVDESISQFVLGGGNVFVCLGEAAGVEPLAPSSMPALVRRWRVPRPGSFLQTVSPSHPVLSIFESISGGIPWSDFRINQYWQIDRRPDDQILMRMAGTEHPALVETPTRDGSGRWLILTTPIPDLASNKPPWNELFSSQEAWPAFILVRSIAQRLSGRDSVNSMTAVGSIATVPVQLPTSNEDEADSIRMQLFPPGDSVPVPIEVSLFQSTGESAETAAEESTVNKNLYLRDVPRSGTYWLRGPGTSAGFSANLDREKLSTRRIDPTVLDERLGKDAYEVIEEVDAIAWRDRQTQDRVLLRSPMMLLALAVFLLEQLLANRFYAGSKSTASGQTRRAAA